ncbi:MAG: DNA polymerase III subunit gamma and tau [Actinobacteria bacterium]|uniref:DNA-directed DNA polymerase n=1 Tax=freshwater metagenome TaxID=449393 RepID=A0A6J6UDZ2_9ZZZZ|nr:DNA polymerase III subunit gamma and tau [Actinomycetota bacterium]
MSLALYRKYRPGQFSDVIGQEHVTVPLSRALDTDRIHHAYLFTGPRGCGKTSSARIMARSMNCEQGPTSNPCGVCQSCVDLAPNGPGSMDVIEIDAATYRGIDDAKELRERAVYAPVSARFKVYIIDEAHQLTRDAFNVLLKLVEEPPPHLRFIFATTEPDKIIPTLRSRTHHYPFRLVSAKTLAQHMALMCEREGIVADPAALALVARAGAGSVRDAQSVLGQVIAGSGPEGVTYADTVAQLGFTDETLLSQVVVAIAQGNGAELFTLIEQIITSGHEPRRFANDLLDHLRDLVVVTQVPDAASSGIFEIPNEQIDDLVAQGKLFTPAQLVRVADLVSSGLSELRGAASPRLQLELLAARLVTNEVTQDLITRVEKLEQGETRPTAAAAPARPRIVAEQPQTSSEETPAAPAKATPPPRPKVSTTPAPLKPSQVTAVAAQQAADAEAESPKILTGPLTFEQIRDAWPTILQTMGSQSRVAGIVMADTAPLSYGEDKVLAVAFANVNTMNNAVKSGHDDRLRLVISKLFHADVTIDPTVDPNRAVAAKPKKAAATDSGDASPEDENLPARSSIDIITSSLGGQVISESSREA